MISLYSFSDNWMDLETENPVRFIAEVETRFKLSRDFLAYVDLIKNGAKADRKMATKRSPWSAGDWIVEPYAPRMLGILRKAIEKGRLEKNDTGVSKNKE